VPERGLAGKAELSFVVPAPARNSHWLLCSPSDLRRGATGRGRAGCLAARSLGLLRPDTPQTTSEPTA